MLLTATVTRDSSIPTYGKGQEPVGDGALPRTPKPGDSWYDMCWGFHKLPRLMWQRVPEGMCS